MADEPNITVGSIAPEFTLPASNGTEISLADYRNKNNVYLFFIREFN